MLTSNARNASNLRQEENLPLFPILLPPPLLLSAYLATEQINSKNQVKVGQGKLKVTLQKDSLSIKIHFRLASISRDGWGLTVKWQSKYVSVKYWVPPE